MELISAQAVQKVNAGLRQIMGDYYDEFKKVLRFCNAIMADFHTRTAPFIKDKECDYEERCVQIYVPEQWGLMHMSKFFEYAMFKCVEWNASYFKFEHNEFEDLRVEIHLLSKEEVVKMFITNECFGILKNYLYFNPQMGFHIEHPEMVQSLTTDAHVQCRGDVWAAVDLKDLDVSITTPSLKMYADYCNINPKPDNEMKQKAIVNLGVKLNELREYIDEQKASNKTFIGSLSGLVKLLTSLKDKPDELVALATQLSTQEPTTCYVYTKASDVDETSMWPY